MNQISNHVSHIEPCSITKRNENHFNLLANDVIGQLYAFYLVILQDARNFMCIPISMAFIYYVP